MPDSEACPSDDGHDDRNEMTKMRLRVSARSRGAMTKTMPMVNKRMIPRVRAMTALIRKE